MSEMNQTDSAADENAEKSPNQFGTWYPIESAPKTATRILVWFPTGVITTARSDDVGHWEAVYLDGAKFWTPLPPPP